MKCYHLSPNEATMQIINRLMDDWSEELSSISMEKGRHFSPNETKLLNRIIVGHPHDKVNLYRMGICTTNICDI